MESSDLERQIKNLSKETKAARIRPLLAVIDEQVREGIEQKRIVEVLQKDGIAITLSELRSYLYRYRLRQKKQNRPEPATPDSGAETPGPNKAEPRSKSEKSAKDRELDELLDPRTRGKYVDKYVHMRPPLKKTKKGDKK